MFTVFVILNATCDPYDWKGRLAKNRRMGACVLDAWVCVLVLERLELTYAR